MTNAASSTPLATLETEHRDLDKQVRALSRKAFLSPSEQQRVAELKKQKLSTKDRIVAMQAKHKGR